MIGFIKLYRDIENCWVWQEKPFSKGQAWIDLLMLANFADVKKPYKGKITTYERGVVNRSIKELAERWGWSRDKTRRFLVLLESDGMVTTKATRHRTTIIIENYTKFQGQPTTDKAINRQPTDNKPTTNRQPISQPADINKNNKERKEREEGKEGKEYIYVGEFENVKLTTLEFQKLQDRFPYDCEERINNLSYYIKSRGDKYKSHYATILNWSRKNDTSKTAEMLKSSYQMMSEWAKGE